MDELEALERALSRDAPSTNYVQGLRKLREGTPREVMEICRAWHGSRFAWPGRRSYIWVTREIEKATKATSIIRRLCAAAGEDVLDVEFEELDVLEER